MKITKKFLKEEGACMEGCKWFLAQKETDGLPIVKKLISEDKLDWANWLIARLMAYKQYVGYAVYAAEQVIGIFEQKYPNDKRPRRAIKAAKRCIESPTPKNKDAAYAVYASAASATYVSAADASYAAAAAASAADAAAAAVSDAAAAAASAAASAADASAAAAYTSYAAAAAASAADAAAAAVSDAAAAEKLKMKLKILNYGIKLLEEIKNEN